MLLSSFMVMVQKKPPSFMDQLRGHTLSFIYQFCAKNKLPHPEIATVESNLARSLGQKLALEFLPNCLPDTRWTKEEIQSLEAGKLPPSFFDISSGNLKKSKMRQYIQFMFNLLKEGVAPNRFINILVQYFNSYNLYLNKDNLKLEHVPTERVQEKPDSFFSIPIGCRLPLNKCLEELYINSNIRDPKELIKLLQLSSFQTIFDETSDNQDQVEQPLNFSAITNTSSNGPTDNDTETYIRQKLDKLIQSCKADEFTLLDEMISYLFEKSKMQSTNFDINQTAGIICNLDKMAHQYRNEFGRQAKKWLAQQGA